MVEYRYQIILFKNDLLSCVERKWNMGKSLAGKELGQGITQRKDGRYQARFTNRFGKRQTIYAKTLNEIRQKLRDEQYEDEKKLNNINLITMQQAFNELKTDMSRKDTRRILIDMYNKAIDAELVLKNIPMQVNTVVNKDSNLEEPRVLTLEETDVFLEAAQHYRYFNTFSLALETGMRIGELLGLKWSDIDFENQTIYVNRTLVYVTISDSEKTKTLES